jgi:hypothetical protein
MSRWMARSTNRQVLEVWPDLATLSLDIHEVFEGGTEIGEATVDAEIGYEGTVLKDDCDRPHASWVVVDEEPVMTPSS